MPCFRSYKAALIVICLHIFPCAGCTGNIQNQADNRHIQLADDLGRKNIDQAIQRSLDYLQARPEHTLFRLTGEEVPATKLIRTLQTFRKILDKNLSAEEFQKEINKQFVFFQAPGMESLPTFGEMLVTGYYQPVVEGSLQKKAPYLFPLYSPPPDLLVEVSKSTGKKKISRFDGPHLTPYWTRQDIDARGKAAGSEMVWLKNPLDVFFLHVQGSGLVRLRDGSIRGVHYAINNGRPYRSIGKFMVKTHRMSIQNASMKTIRTYLTNHPDERDQILFTNPSYIFFTWTKTHGAIGNIGQELTPGRSIAVDQKVFPAGALAFLLTKEPVIAHNTLISWKPVHRFVLVQDSGSAIQGTGRVDLFQGAGKEAGLAAGAMKEKGALYFLLVREENARPVLSPETAHHEK
ncbi:MAG: transglycosylase [Desulfobulbus sp.]|nr:MAG: transglycosylase [Desulfobulbus sp.]